MVEITPRQPAQDVAALGWLAAVQRLAAVGLTPVEDETHDHDIVELLVDGLFCTTGAVRVRKVSLGVLDQVVYEADPAQQVDASVPVTRHLGENDLRELVGASAPVVWRNRRGEADGLLVPLMSRVGSIDVYLVESEPEAGDLTQQDVMLAGTLRDQAATALALREARARGRLDPLTGCLNHGAMHAQLEKEIARVQRRHSSLSCVMLDIDGFKSINDDRGHPLGDHVVREVAAALLEECRRYDSCARYGGDEFLVILPDTEIVDAVRAAERMREAVARWARSDPRVDFPVTITAGVADWHAPEMPDALIERVDKALMAGKMAGKDCVGLA